MKLSACIARSASQLEKAGLVFGHGTDNAWDEAAWLVLYALGLPVNEQADSEQELDEQQQAAAAALINERIVTRKPVAYLTGTAWFAGLPFHITEGVIIPRSHIGGFLLEAGKPWVQPESVHQVLDLCTGSACIAITAALTFPDAQVDASDISPLALELARQNIGEYGLEDRVKLIHSSLYENITGSYDLILTNPPYVPDTDVAAFPAEYQHEPRLAFAGGKDGLDLVHTILKEAKDYLNPGGLLVGEVGESWVNLQQCYPQIPFNWLETGVEDSGLFVINREELDLYF